MSASPVVLVESAMSAPAKKWTAEEIASRKKKLTRIFILLATIQIIINLDGGAVPAGLMHIGATFDMSTAELGLLAMLVYQGIALGCLTIGPLTRYVSPLRAQQVTLVLNIAATFLFGAAQSKGMLLTFRVLIGFLQAMPAVYFPVWVDEFAPAATMTGWMAVINAGAPLGITIGYVFSGVLNSGSADPLSPEYVPCAASDLRCAWRWPFYLQSIVLVALGVFVMFIPKSLFDLGAEKPPAEDEEGFVEAQPVGVEAVEMKGADEPKHVPRQSQRERGFSMADYLVEALQGPASRPIDSAPEEPASPASPASASRADRMATRMARMSAALPESTPSSYRASEGGASPVSTTNAKTSNASSQQRPSRFSSRAAERLSTRGQRLTVTDNEQGGRGRVVSVLDMFTSPYEELLDTDRGGHNASRRDSASSSAAPDGAPPARFQPKLAPIEQSMSNLRGAVSDAEHSGKVAAEGSTQAPAIQEEEQMTPPGKPRNLLCELLGNGVYIYTVMALSALFFVVTGIQVWVTSYIVIVIGKKQADVTPAFGVTSITAPILGVFAGGSFIDKIGGYKGDSAMALTLKWCCVFACCAAGAAITCAWVPKALADQGVRCVSNTSSPFYVPPDEDSATAGFWTCIGLIALTLVFGGAIIPAATGCLVAAVPADLRQISSAMSMFCFQQLGYAMSPLVSSLIGSMASIDRGSVMACLDATCAGVNTSAGAECPTQELINFEMDAAQEVASLELCFQVRAWPSPHAPPPVRTRPSPLPSPATLLTPLPAAPTGRHAVRDHRRRLPLHGLAIRRGARQGRGRRVLARRGLPCQASKLKGERARARRAPSPPAVARSCRRRCGHCPPACAHTARRAKLQRHARARRTPRTRVLHPTHQPTPRCSPHRPKVSCTLTGYLVGASRGTRRSRRSRSCPARRATTSTARRASRRGSASRSGGGSSLAPLRAPRDSNPH